MRCGRRGTGFSANSRACDTTIAEIEALRGGSWMRGKKTSRRAGRRKPAHSPHIERQRAHQACPVGPDWSATAACTAICNGARSASPKVSFSRRLSADS